MTNTSTPSSVRTFAAAFAAVALAATAMLAACGTKVEAPLPDTAAKSTPAPGASRPLTKEEQKKAIDDMMAKRDQK